MKIKITFRPWDNRYMARQRILGQNIIAYGKTKTLCKSAFIKKYREFCKHPVKNQPKHLTFKQYYERWYKENKEPFISKETKKDILRVLRQYSPLTIKDYLCISKWMGHSKVNITKDVYMSVEYRLNADKIRGLYGSLFYRIWHNFWHN